MRTRAVAVVNAQKRFIAKEDLSRYDTIRDAILTCARKLTRVGLIYRTERYFWDILRCGGKSSKQFAKFLQNSIFHNYQNRLIFDLVSRNIKRGRFLEYRVHCEICGLSCDATARCIHLNCSVSLQVYMIPVGKLH